MLALGVRIALFFAFFCSLWADFCFSKTPLNIKQYLPLTKLLATIVQQEVTKRRITFMYQ
jgi:hypothetical protein